MELDNALPSSTVFSRFDAEFMPDAHVTEFTRQMEAVRMLIFRSIILCVMKPVPRFPLKPIANWTAIHRFWKAVRPRWPFEVWLDKKTPASQDSGGEGHNSIKHTSNSTLRRETYPNTSRRW